MGSSQNHMQRIVQFAFRDGATLNKRICQRLRVRRDREYRYTLDAAEAVLYGFRVAIRAFADNELGNE